jgi:hypothetical protein
VNGNIILEKILQPLPPEKGPLLKISLANKIKDEFVKKWPKI